MAWSKGQIKMVWGVIRRHHISTEHAKLLLRQVSNSMYDAQGKRQDDPSTKSARLTNVDLDQYLALIERAQGGQLGHWEAGHWNNKFMSGEGSVQRYRHGIGELDIWLIKNKAGWGATSLERFIDKRVRMNTRLEALSQDDLKTLYRALEGLKNWTMKQRPQSEGGSLYDHAV